jgi:hypothetical protein
MKSTQPSFHADVGRESVAVEMMGVGVGRGVSVGTSTVGDGSVGAVFELLGGARTVAVTNPVWGALLLHPAEYKTSAVRVRIASKGL